jgi:hypothetical protein
MGMGLNVLSCAFQGMELAGNGLVSACAGLGMSWALAGLGMDRPGHVLRWECSELGMGCADHMMDMGGKGYGLGVDWASTEHGLR